jgi:hypothetical protein
MASVELNSPVQPAYYNSDRAHTGRLTRGRVPAHRGCSRPDTVLRSPLTEATGFRSSLGVRSVSKPL